MYICIICWAHMRSPRAACVWDIKKCDETFLDHMEPNEK